MGNVVQDRYTRDVLFLAQKWLAI